MLKDVLTGALFSVLLTGSACAAAAGRPPAQDWIVTPADDSCHIDFDLTGRSGASVQVSLVSDGDHVTLAFPKDDVAEQAFVPIRIDQKPYSNLVRRTQSGKVGLMILGDETLAALKKGSTLQIAWLGDEPMGASLVGFQRAVSDLRTCGTQVAGQYRIRQAADRDAQARQEADARAKAVSDEQLATAKAQTAAAEAERQRVAAEADRLQAEADAQRQNAAMEAQRQQAQAEAQARQQAAYSDDSWGAQQQPPQDYDPQPYRRRYYPAYGYGQ